MTERLRRSGGPSENCVQYCMQPIGLAASFLWFGIPSLVLRFTPSITRTLASFLGFVPGTTLPAFVCQQRKSTWPGVIAYTIQNSAIPIMLARGVLS